MKFLPVCRVSECPFAPHWDWQMDQKEILAWSKDSHSKCPSGQRDHSLVTDTAPTLLKILFAATWAGLWWITEQSTIFSARVQSVVPLQGIRVQERWVYSCSVQEKQPSHRQTPPIVLLMMMYLAVGTQLSYGKLSQVCWKGASRWHHS